MTNAIDDCLSEALAAGAVPGLAGAAWSSYWIDSARLVTGVIGAQVLPFNDPAMAATFSAFESAVYTTVG